MPGPLINATWKPHTKTADYNTGSNWVGGQVPNGIATFGASNHHNLTFSQVSADVGTWIFKAGAPHYVFTIGSGQAFLFDAAGIKSGRAVVSLNLQGAALDFADSAGAGSAHFTLTGASTLNFGDATSAGSAHINVGDGADLSFFDSATARSATIVSHGATSFSGSANADHANITIAGGGLVFEGGSNAEHATITTESGTILFAGSSSGGAAHFVTKADGVVDFSDSSAEMFAGSIAGAGQYDLGGKILTLTGNNSTLVTGLIQDGGFGGGTGGSIDKQGTGKLTLDGENSYTGGTVLEHGALKIAELHGAGTGDITFEAGRQTLQINNEAMDTASATARFFDTNTIVSFGAGDVIDLIDLKFVKHAHAVYDSGTGDLTITSGRFVDHVTLSSPAATNFKVANDGHGGSKVTIVLPTAHEKPAGSDHVASDDTDSTTIDALTAHHPSGDFIL